MTPVTGTSTAADSTTDEAGRLAVLRARLAVPMPDDGPWGWLGPLLVTAFGAFLRFDRLRVGVVAGWLSWFPRGAELSAWPSCGAGG